MGLPLPSTIVEITPPAAFPISTAEAKLHAHVDQDDEDALVDVMIGAATGAAQRETGRQLMPATRELVLSAWPSASARIPIPTPPLSSIVSIKYQDGDDVEQTLAEGTDYEVDTAWEPGTVYPSTGATWPTVFDRPDAIRIRFVAGYADADSVPDAAKIAIRQLVAHLFRQRESFHIGQGFTLHRVPLFFEDLLSEIKIWEVY